MRRIAFVVLLAACRGEQHAPPPPVAKPKPAPVAQTQTVAPVPVVDNSVPIKVANCAENHISFVGVQPNTMHITGADGQTIEESTELHTSDFRKEAFMVGLDASKAYVVEARLIGNFGRVERMVRCGTRGELLRVETGEVKTGGSFAPPVRVAIAGTGPSKVAYRDEKGVMVDVPMQVSVGSATGDLEPPVLHLAATSLGKLVEMTITAEDPSGIASIQYIFIDVQQELQTYTEPVKFDPRLWTTGYAIATDKVGNKAEVEFSFER